MIGLFGYGVEDTKFWFILWGLLMVAYYSAPLIYHGIKRYICWLDDKEYKAAWSPWYFLYNIFVPHSFDIYKRKYSYIDMAFGGIFLTAFITLGIRVWEVSIFFILFILISIILRTTKRVHKKIKAHIADTSVHVNSQSS